MDTYILHAPESFAVVLILLALRQRVAAAAAALAFLAFYRGAGARAGAAIADGRDPRVVYSPCEGRVSRVDVVGDRVRVCVFLNIHNVHVQYSPVAGTVTATHHKPGSFHPAFMFQKSERNERFETHIATARGPVTVVQIAGLVARRIVAFLEPGAAVRPGTPLGLIKFGSRVDVLVPRASAAPLVREGQAVRIGDPVFRFRV